MQVVGRRRPPLNSRMSFSNAKVAGSTSGMRDVQQKTAGLQDLLKTDVFSVSSFFKGCSDFGTNCDLVSRTFALMSGLPRCKYLLQFPIPDALDHGLHCMTTSP